MEIKKVIVLGGGAVGSVLAAALSEKTDIHLNLIGRKKHVQQINNHGLEINDQKKRIFKFKCRESIKFSLKNTLVILAIKATGLADSVKQILPFIETSTIFFLAQNGLGIESILLKNSEAKITDRQIFRGIVGFGSTFFSPGIVQYFSGKLIIDHRFLGSPYANVFEDTFLTTYFSSNMENLIWKKAIINSIYNPLSVILKVKNHVIAEEGLNPIKRGLLSEGLAVCRSLGINLQMDLEKLNEIVSSHNITSMLQDFFKGKPSEIDFINGAISRLGKKQNIPTPINDFIFNVIKAKEMVNQYNLAVHPDPKPE